MADCSQNAAGHVYIGPAGWDYADWKGVVYPDHMPRGLHPLTYLSKFFDTVEVNSTFYRPARADYTARWVQHVEDNPRFKFTAKLWQRFTHDRDSVPVASEVAAVKTGLAPLAESGRFGGLLAQFPWSFRNTAGNRDWLDMVFDRFAEYPVALEVRHASWNVPEMHEYLHDKRAAICNIDQPMYRDSIAPADVVTARLGYVRMHGQNYKDWFREDAGRDERYNYLYSDEELDPWVDRIRRIQELAETVFVITNNHYQGKAVVNAFQLEYKLTGAKAEIPACLRKTYPQLASISSSTGPDTGTQMNLPGM